MSRQNREYQILNARDVLFNYVNSRLPYWQIYTRGAKRFVFRSVGANRNLTFEQRFQRLKIALSECTPDQEYCVFFATEKTNNYSTLEHAYIYIGVLDFTPFDYSFDQLLSHTGSILDKNLKPEPKEMDGVPFIKYEQLLKDFYDLRESKLLLEQELKLLKDSSDKPSTVDKLLGFVNDNKETIAGFLFNSAQVARQASPMSGINGLATAQERLTAALKSLRNADPNFIDRIEWLAEFANSNFDQYKLTVNSMGIGPKII